MPKPEDLYGREMPHPRVLYKGEPLVYKWSLDRGSDFWTTSENVKNPLLIRRNIVNKKSLLEASYVEYQFPEKKYHVVLGTTLTGNSVEFTGVNSVDAKPNQRIPRVFVQAMYDQETGELVDTSLSVSVYRNEEDEYPEKQTVFDQWFKNFKYHFEVVQDDGLVAVVVKKQDLRMVATLPLRLWGNVGPDLFSFSTFKWAKKAEYIEDKTSINLSYPI